jgi:hypothetical protein
MLGSGNLAVLRPGFVLLCLRKIPVLFQDKQTREFFVYQSVWCYFIIYGSFVPCSFLHLYLLEQQRISCYIPYVCHLQAAQNHHIVLGENVMQMHIVRKGRLLS